MDTGLHYLYGKFPHTTEEMVEEAVSRLTKREQEQVRIAFEQGPRKEHWQMAHVWSQRGHPPIDPDSFKLKIQGAIKKITSYIKEQAQAGLGMKEGAPVVCEHEYLGNGDRDVCQKCGQSVLKDEKEQFKREFARIAEKRKKALFLLGGIRAAEGSERANMVHSARVVKRLVPTDYYEEFSQICQGLETTEHGGRIVFLYHDGLNLRQIKQELRLSEDRVDQHRILAMTELNKIFELQEDISPGLKQWFYKFCNI